MEKRLFEEENYLEYMFLDKCDKCSTKSTSSWLRVLDDTELELLNVYSLNIYDEKWEGLGWSFEFFYEKAYNFNIEIGNVSLISFFDSLGKYFNLIVSLIKFEDENGFVTKKLKTRNKIRIIEQASNRFVVLLKEEMDRRLLNIANDKNYENIGKITSEITLNKTDEIKEAKNTLRQISKMMEE